MSALRLWDARRPRGDEGFGLLLVVGCMLVGTMLAFATLNYALSTQRFSKKNQDWNAALAAAQAGIDDYVAYLNRNDNYARDPIDCSNVAMKGPSTCGTAVGWKPVESTDPLQGSFHYDIDPSKLDSDGYVQVTSTGKAGSRSRTLQVGVGKKKSTNFLYYTDHEDADPDNKSVYSGGMDSRCSDYWWDGRKAVSSAARCSEINFVGGDVLDGLGHTNDTPLTKIQSGLKPRFALGFETSDPACQAADKEVPTTWTACDRNGIGADYGTSYPRYAETLDLQDNSLAFADYPGCQYQGATRIVFQSNGTMKVWSKESTVASGTTIACGGTAPFGVSVNVPSDKVIYVNPGVSGLHQCVKDEIGDGLPLGTYTGANTAPFTYDQNMIQETQKCGNGNAYLEGVLKGRVTVATANSITVTGDLVLANGLGGSDMLGLVATNSVEVFHPMLSNSICTAYRSSGSCKTYGVDPSADGSEVSGWPKRYPDVDNGNVPYPATGVQITGSVQTLLHSFLVQAYDVGSMRGNLYLRGSLAQRWRGIVGTTGSTGYLKEYRYDKRLKYSSPPFFPEWTKAKWAANYTGEISPRY